jgi:DUF2924 family protein
MAPRIEKEVAALRQMTVAQLRILYENTFGDQPRSRHKEHLLRRIAWKIQAISEGDLSERARQRAAALADDACLRVSIPRNGSSSSAETTSAGTTPTRDKRVPMPGTILARPYRGQTLEVKVLKECFEYDGQRYRSLTAVAQEITGQHWNGFHFFGLQKRGTSNE